tara:strand:- start:1333 stop:2028 length:696 start_codon:yes stop_codon:yes gene_type:complete
MAHTPFHVLQERKDAFLARGKELYEAQQGLTGGYAGAFAAQSGMLPELSGSDKAALLAYQASISSQNRARGLLGQVGGGLTGLFQTAGKQGLVKDFKGYLGKQGFSKEEQLKFFQALDKDPTEFFGDKMPAEKGEQIRFLKEYFKEAQDLYQASADTEREMIREERASREQAEFDKAQREAFGLTEQQQGELADRERKKQQSQQYLQSRGGVSSRQAQRSGMVMIPQARPA